MCLSVICNNFLPHSRLTRDWQTKPTGFSCERESFHFLPQKNYILFWIRIRSVCLLPISLRVCGFRFHSMYGVWSLLPFFSSFYLEVIGLCLAIHYPVQSHTQTLAPVPKQHYWAHAHAYVSTRILEVYSVYALVRVPIFPLSSSLGF